MSGRSEEELAEALRRDRPGALDEALVLIEGSHPYSAGRAAELLVAESPGAAADRIVAAFGRERPPSIWWYALRVWVEAYGTLPSHQGQDVPLDRHLTHPKQIDADALFHLLGLVDALPVEAADRLLRSAVSHVDDEIAVEAVEQLLRREVEVPLDSVARLAAVAGGELGTRALVVRIELGDADAIAPAVEALGERDAHAYRLVDALERAQNRDLVVGALRPLIRRRWFANALTSRIAGCAAALGDDEALDMLRTLGKSRRERVRAVALAELVRVGTDDDVSSVLQIIGSPYERASASVAGELWRRDDPRVRVGTIDLATGHRDPQVRLAALYSLSRWPRDQQITDAIRRIADLDGDDLVAAAATRHLG